MAGFRVTITTEGVGIGAAREALEQAGFELREPGWAPETQTGSYGAMGGPQVVAEVDADSAADAERLVSEALPDHDYTVTAEPRQ